jgi:PAS domain S-box-containing protein
MEKLTSTAKSTVIRSLCEAIQDIVFFKNPNGEYLFANHAFERLYGYTLEQIMGKSDYEFLVEDEADYFASRDKEAVEAGRPTHSEAWQVNELTGAQECYLTVKMPVFSEDGQLIGLLGVVKDVTKVKQAEEVLRNQKFPD